MTRKPSRTEWRLKGGRWTRSLGNRGARVRLFQKRSEGLFYRDVWTPEKGHNKKCLGTTDRDEADRMGKALVAGLLREDETISHGVLSLSVLWEHYKADCVAYQDHTLLIKKEMDARYLVLATFFGPQCDVRDLTEHDQIAFAKKRLAGGIIIGKNKDDTDRVTPKVRLRSAQADVELLRSMLHWATTFRLRSGGRLLDRDPLAGVKRPGRGTNPRRPLATHERFIATRRAIQELAEESDDEGHRQRWLKLELALVIAEATGRRLGSIRQLKWSDIDFRANRILWSGATDKMGVEAKVPMSKALRDELRSFRAKMGGTFGGLLFPSETDRDKPIRRDVFGKWLQQAERRAELVKLDGSLWHAYRRSWATERKDFSPGWFPFVGGGGGGNSFFLFSPGGGGTFLPPGGGTRKEKGGGGKEPGNWPSNWPRFS